MTLYHTWAARARKAAGFPLAYASKTHYRTAEGGAGGVGTPAEEEILPVLARVEGYVEIGL